MEFGRVKDIRGFDLALPPDDPATSRILRGAGRETGPGTDPGPGAGKSGGLDVLLGLALWNDNEMARLLCPAGTPRNRRLHCYSRQFNAIELNTSGYGLAPANVRTWAAQTPPGFRFLPKAPRDVTHGPDLTRAHDLYEEFGRAALGFGDRLGTVLMQFPESFGPSRFRELESFLRVNAFLLPLAVEMRNRDWFMQRGPREAWFALMEELGIAAAITDTPGRRDAVHMRLTSRQAFIRFSGHDRSEPDLLRIRDWAGRLKVWMDQGLERLHLTFHHVPDYVSAEWAADFIRELNLALDLDLPVPKLGRGNAQESPQTDLFAS